MNLVTLPGQLDHERLHAYQVALELDAVVVEVARQSGRGNTWLRDQATRASGGVVLQIAEAVGREGADRAQRIRIARGSLLETDATLALFDHRGLCSPEARAAAYGLTVRLAPMLQAFLRSALR